MAPVRERDGRARHRETPDYFRGKARPSRWARKLWLGVWERNDRARAFYVKCGFADAGEHIFLFGTDPQTDLIMVSAV